MIGGNNAPPGADDDLQCPWHDRPEPVEREYDKYDDIDDVEEEYDYDDQV